MPSAENGKLEFESGQSATPMSALTDSGDATTFTSDASLWSGKSGYAPDVKPNGLATGGAVIPAVSGSNDVVDVEALTAYLAGVKVSVSAAIDVAITRAATDVASITSITVNSAGSVVVVKGTDSADATFVETRGAAGGPPLIPVGSIEIAQVRTTTNVAGALTTGEILSVTGVHKERYDFPLWTEDNQNAQAIFASALPLIHTGGLPKGVFASYADPIFAELSLSVDFVPAETTHSVSSTPIYNATLGSTSSSLGQASFTAYLQDGVTDSLVKGKNETLWFRFTPDRFKSSYILTQGKLGIARTFPAGDSIQAACTVSASSPSVEVE